MNRARGIMAPRASATIASFSAASALPITAPTPSDGRNSYEGSLGVRGAPGAGGLRRCWEVPAHQAACP